MRIGIDLGGTNIAAGIVDIDGKIIAKDSVKTPLNADEIVEQMKAVSLKLCEAAGTSIANIRGAGIGFPGSIDAKNGIVVFANNLDIENAPMAAMFSEKLEIPVRIDNDANAAALGEFSALGDKCDTMLLVTLGTGVGGGIIIGGKIYDGFNGMAGEIGHMVIIQDGEPCTCGRKGCWEAYASATGLIRETKNAMKANPSSLLHRIALDRGKISGRNAFMALHKNDKAAEEVVERYLTYVAIGIANCINILQPEILCLGGGIANEGDELIERLKPLIEPEIYKVGERKTELRLAKLKNDAGIIGAAMLV